MNHKRTPRSTAIKRIDSTINNFFSNPLSLAKSPLEIRENSNFHD